MTREQLIQDYIELISKDGFHREDENYYIKNVGSKFQQVFYNNPDQNYIKLIIPDYMEGREIDLVAKVDYSTFRNFENGEHSKQYIGNLINTRRRELIKEIICVNAIEDIQTIVEDLGYDCDNIFYDYPYKKGYGFSYLEYPSGTRYEYKHIAQTDYITVIEESDQQIKTIILNSVEIQKLKKDNLVDSIKEILNNKNVT